MVIPYAQISPRNVTDSLSEYLEHFECHGITFGDTRDAVFEALESFETEIQDAQTLLAAISEDEALVVRLSENMGTVDSFTQIYGHDTMRNMGTTFAELRAEYESRFGKPHETSCGLLWADENYGLSILEEPNTIRIHFRKRQEESKACVSTKEPPTVIDLEALQVQFRGRKFGELVLHHCQKQNLPATNAAMVGYIRALPLDIEVASSVCEQWIDDVVPFGTDEEFWRLDCDRVFDKLCQEGRQRLQEHIPEPSDYDVFCMFQVALLNYACCLHSHPLSKAFVRKAMGVSFWRCLFNL